MKRISLLLSLALLSVVFVSSCKKEVPGTYSYTSLYQSNMADTTVCREIVDLCKTFDYFKQQHSYTGTYSECCVKAATEFFTAVDLIGDEPISSKLKFNEFFRIILMNKECGEIIAHSIWSSDKDEEETPEVEMTDAAVSGGRIQ